MLSVEFQLVVVYIWVVVLIHNSCTVYIVEYCSQHIRHSIVYGIVCIDMLSAVGQECAYSNRITHSDTFLT